MKSYTYKLLLLAVAIIGLSLCLTYYQILLGFKDSGDEVHLKPVSSLQKWKIQSAPVGNIFNADRKFKSKTEHEKPKQSAGKKSEYRLIGVFISGKKQMALFSYRGKSIQLSLGDKFATFGTVININNDRVESALESGQTFEWLIFPVPTSSEKEDNKQ